MWGRIPGTQSETWTNEWVEAKFRALGLKDIRRQPFDLPPQWFPVSCELQRPDRRRRGAAEAGDGAAGDWDPARCRRPASISSRSGSSLGSAADFLGRDVRGKAVVISNEIGEAAGSQTPSWMARVQARARTRAPRRW